LLSRVAQSLVERPIIEQSVPVSDRKVYCT
jgi:hypothetical protein